MTWIGDDCSRERSEEEGEGSESSEKKQRFSGRDDGFSLFGEDLGLSLDTLVPKRLDVC